MRFTKMEGAGNDYIYVDCFSEPAPEAPERLAVEVSRPHFGIGSDGLILIEPSEVADARMRIFNADGSEAKMCGNGIRCAAKCLYDLGHVRSKEMMIDTRSGVKRVELLFDGARVTGARVDMGAPDFTAAAVPVLTDGERLIREPVTIEGEEYLMTCVSMGNPHAVLFVEALPDDELFFRVGEALQRDPRFPDQVNVEFAQVLSEDRIQVRVFERGSGETLACGTGACAVFAAAREAGRVKDTAEIGLKGGLVRTEWANGQIIMSGPARTVYVGEWVDG